MWDNVIEYIPLSECQHGHLYKILSRNLKIGIFNQTDKGFIGIREKFGSLYLFTEYHWDTGVPFGTVKPQEDLGVCDLELLDWPHKGKEEVYDNLYKWLEEKEKEI